MAAYNVLAQSLISKFAAIIDGALLLAPAHARKIAEQYLFEIHGDMSDAALDIAARHCAFVQLLCGETAFARLYFHSVGAENAKLNTMVGSAVLLKNAKINHTSIATAHMRVMTKLALAQPRQVMHLFAMFYPDFAHTLLVNSIWNDLRFKNETARECEAILIAQRIWPQLVIITHAYHCNHYHILAGNYDPFVIVAIHYGAFGAPMRFIEDLIGLAHNPNLARFAMRAAKAGSVLCDAYRSLIADRNE